MVSIFFSCFLNIVVFLNCPAIYAQEGSVENSTGEQIEQELSPEEKEELKDKDIKIAFILLGGVIFIGAFTIFLVILWGYRVRRVIREPLAPCPKVDPLWFLKSQIQAHEKDAESSPDADPAQQETEDQE